MAGQIEAAEWLLAHGADVNAMSHNGHTPLALVTVCPDAAARAALMELLLSHHADPDAAAGHHQGRVIHEAIKIRDQALVKLLLEHEVDLNAQDASGKTAVHEAVAQNTTAIVELLLDHAPDLTIKTRKHVQQRGGETALDYARNRNRKTITRILEEQAAR
jgi:ankyrin repeat protein